MNLHEMKPNEFEFIIRKEESKMSDIRENKQALNNLMQKIGNAVLPVLENVWEKVVIGYFI